MSLDQVPVVVSELCVLLGQSSTLAEDDQRDQDHHQLDVCLSLIESQVVVGSCRLT